MDNKKNANLEEELQPPNEHLQKYTAPASKSESCVIAEAMRKSGSCFYNNDDELSNSSHDMGVALGSISCSHENETDLDGIVNSKTSRILVERYADQDKVTTKHRFTTESCEQFRLHRTTPNGHKHV